MNLPPDSRTSPLLTAIGRSWWVLMLYGVVAVVFGLIAITRPLSAATALAWARRTAIAIDARSRASTPSSSSVRLPVSATI